MAPDRRRPSALPALAVLLAAVVAAAGPAQGTALQVLTTPSGIRLWLREEPAIPIVALEVAFRGGSALDPAGREGLAAMAAALLGEGAGDLDSRAFRERLDASSVRMSFRAGRDAFYASLTTLADRLDEAGELFRLALSAPRFDPGPVERIRTRILADLAHDREDPHTRAWRAWAAAAFPDHPYGRPPDGTPASVAAIAASDLAAFAATHLARDRVRVAVAGAIDAAAAVALVERVLAGLPERGPPPAIAGTVPVTGRVEIVEMATPQSVIVFGLPAPGRDDPDFYAAQVLDRALGGGSESRLFREVRSARGLAYAVSSGLYSRQASSLWLGQATTRNARAGETLEVVRAVLAEVAAHGLAPEELADARAWLKGALALRLDGNRSIARALLAIQLDGLGADYLDRRPGLIERVTAADVRRVARRLLAPADPLVVVVGRPEGIAVGGE